MVPIRPLALALGTSRTPPRHALGPLLAAGSQSALAVASTTCSRSYRTAQVSRSHRVCESRTAPAATPWHENHCGTRVVAFHSFFVAQIRSSSGFQTVLNFVVTNKTVLRFVVKIDFKTICGSAQVPESQKAGFLAME